MLQGKNIIVGITGGIAAYKIPLLIRMLKKEGAEVRVLVTDVAKNFVTPLTLSVVSENPVATDFFDSETGQWNSHIDLGLWADALLLAPLTANTMAKMAAGIADNLLLTVVLSARCPLFFAPTMDMDMFKNVVTQQNIVKLQALGYYYIEPAKGELASGLKGLGRMPEPEELFSILAQYFKKNTIFNDKHVLISAGPTHEPIDPVRFIGNNSTGKMGIELAKTFAQQGAIVELVLGPTQITTGFPGISVHSVITAKEMTEVCKNLFPQNDIVVMAAAVADFTPKVVSATKIKKEIQLNSITLKPTEDILSSLGKMKKNGQILIGFALETDNELENAKKKLQKKNLDMIVLNSLQDMGAGFGFDTNKITLIKKGEKPVYYILKSKKEVAQDIVSEIAKYI